MLFVLSCKQHPTLVTMLRLCPDLLWEFLLERVVGLVPRVEIVDTMAVISWVGLELKVEMSKEQDHEHGG